MRVKICCIQNVEEARLAVRHGAGAIGLVSQMPSGFGPISEERIADIAASVPSEIATFLLTCKQDAASIIAQQRRTNVTTIQLCDRVDDDVYANLRHTIPDVELVQVIHVRALESIDEAVRVAPLVDAILLDSGNQQIAIKELGGTGRVHDWAVSAKIVSVINRPVYLAGGLNPQNAALAVDRVRPFGLDVCTGLRTGGMLDEAKVAAFFAAINT